MYEKRHHPIAPFPVFVKRIFSNLGFGFGIILFSLGIGMAGYSYFEGLSFVDSYLNAAMILSGMGEIDQIKTVGGKFFAGSYALFSGVVFLVVIAIILAPVFHRFFHKFLIQDKTSK
jgi:hypothetical protein